MLLLVYKYYTSSEVNYFSALILDNTVHCETVKYPASVAYVSLSQVVDIQMYWIMAKKNKHLFMDISQHVNIGIVEHPYSGVSISPKNSVYILIMSLYMKTNGSVPQVYLFVLFIILCC